uniref:hypothetical protein n=1 Tax=Polynucleobacter sp. TaxID=2029855 RepID=UPI004048AF88
MKSIIGSLLLVGYLGFGLAKGWEQEVYLLIGALCLVFFNAFINAEFVEGFHKKIDELIKAFKK